jgi:3',5'-cyclic AMP phosphodiesterase CpdA
MGLDDAGLAQPAGQDYDDLHTAPAGTQICTNQLSNPLLCLTRGGILKKIIHLPDLHAGYGDLTSRLGELVTRMIFHKTPADNYIVVITGDLVENAMRAGSYAEASIHLNRLGKAGFTVLAVPGNHDYGTGNLGNPAYIKRFKKHFFGTVRTTYPKLDWIDEIAFMGELGKKQLRRLSTMLASSEVATAEYRVVYLHHHPFHPKPLHELRDSQELGEILSAHPIDALLFGHNHDGRVWNGQWGIRRVYDGGTSTGKDGGSDLHRVMDLSRDPSFDYDARF